MENYEVSIEKPKKTAHVYAVLSNQINAVLGQEREREKKKVEKYGFGEIAYIMIMGSNNGHNRMQFSNKMIYHRFARVCRNARLWLSNCFHVNALRTYPLYSFHYQRFVLLLN